jgi:hypothetical protein
MISSFSENKKDEDRPNRQRYADNTPLSTPNCKEPPLDLGITTTSAYS